MSEITSDGSVVALRPHPNSLAALRTEVEQLRGALQSGIVIEQAKGAISARHNTTPDVAFDMMRGPARSQHHNLHEYATAIIANSGRFDC